MSVMCVLSCFTLQENIEVLHTERVVHRAIMSYFTYYSPQLGRYGVTFA